MGVLELTGPPLRNKRPEMNILMICMYWSNLFVIVYNCADSFIEKECNH